MDFVAQFERYWQKVPHQLAAFWLCWLFVVYLIYLTARLTWALLPVSANAEQWQPPQVSSLGANDPGINLSNILSLNLFGQYQAVKPQVQQQVTKAPETKLNLTLTGVVASTDVKFSAAIIENGGKQATYFIGDKIDKTSATLREIHPDRVILRNRGSHETLMLAGIDYSGTERAAKKPPKATPRQQVDQRRNRRLTESLRKTKDAAKSNEDLIGKLTDYIRVSPVKEEGALKGFRVNPGKDHEMFQSMGLQPNDLAVGINGLDLTDMGQAMSVMDELPEMDEISLTIERDGQQYEILFSLPGEQ
ncbi:MULTISPECIES: type II secretion system protein GspC [Corallincola]|uniref:Type II secretion system protein GspC n=3 Tax=Corallincola TaxID=1775176 RepID=A0A368NLV2_9GAMM|nr:MULTISPECIES: type II secretion system protein GspC [Corallincola]RCU51136.1 type II secretion system protein GspC [Corallincola holothuriorum]TAA46068.1 type II secretion system protein GspC [Corallincola spongiicola]TCI01432.1 type II secretion system protein GspC [Corallincola luteus]